MGSQPCKAENNSLSVTKFRVVVFFKALKYYKKLIFLGAEEETD